jgi:hypothetical protein
MKKIQLYLILILSLSSCVAKIDNLATYKKQPILTSDLFNVEDLKKNKSSIVVLEFDNKKNKLANRANLNKTLAVKIEATLLKNKLVILQDRSAFKKLAKEISLAELNSTGSYTGPKQVEYAITGDIETAEFFSKYRAAQSVMDASSGTYIYIPASTKYKAKVSGNIKIYKIPSLEIVTTVPFADTESFSENGRGSNNSRLANNLLRKAAVNSIKKSSHKLQNFFSEKRKAYILEKRNKKKQSIFQISLGKKSGIRPDQKVAIFSKRKQINNLTDESYFEDILLGTGVISNVVNNNTAWIFVKDAEVANKVLLGDYVTVEFKKPLFSYFY